MIATGFATTAGPGVGRTGYTPAQLPAWQRALARVRDNTADARMLWLGDSQTAGIGCTNYATNPSLGAPPTRSAGVLQSLGVPASIGLCCPANGSTLWTLGSGWAAQTFGFGLLACFNSNASAFTLTFADPRTTADTFDIYCMTGAGLGTVSAVATGGSTGTLNTGIGGTGISKFTVTAAAAGTGNSVVITPTLNPCYIVGVEPRLSTTRKVLVGNAGIGTCSTGQHVALPVTWGSIPAIQAYAPDLTIIQLGVNDRLQGINIPTYQSNLRLLITAAQVSGDVLLTSSMPSGTAVANVNEAGYNNVLAGFGLPYFDYYSRCGSYASYTARGMSFDGLHPGELGYWDWAASLVAPLVMI